MIYDIQNSVNNITIQLYLFIFFIKEINNIILQGCIKLTNCDSKDINNIYKRFPFEIFYGPKNLEKIYYNFHKYIKQHNCF